MFFTHQICDLQRSRNPTRGSHRHMTHLPVTVRWHYFVRKALGNCHMGAPSTARAPMAWHRSMTYRHFQPERKPYVRCTSNGPKQGCVEHLQTDHDMSESIFTLWDREGPVGRGWRKKYSTICRCPRGASAKGWGRCSAHTCINLAQNSSSCKIQASLAPYILPYYCSIFSRTSTSIIFTV
jgi:hypothetical protein